MRHTFAKKMGKLQNNDYNRGNIIKEQAPLTKAQRNATKDIVTPK
jgi:hypothetical protein